MITNLKIPSEYSVEQVKACMDILAVDPNFLCLLSIIEANDMAKLRESIENPATPDSELKENRYRLAVFKQLFSIVPDIRKACESGNAPEEAVDDPYHTEKTLRE